MSGQTINERYRIKKKLSANTERSIYLAEDTHRFNESCIVKEYRQNLAKVKQEAKILYQLNHPQIVSFRESFTLVQEAQESTYLVEDYIEGLTYSELSHLDQSHAQKLNEEEIKERLKQILPVLDYLHSKGIAHGDLSSSSIIESSHTHQPILIDFSLACYDSSALIKDFSALALMTLSLYTERESFSPAMFDLLNAMQQGKFQSASKLLKALETLEVSPTTPTEVTPTTYIESPSKNTSTFLTTDSQSLNPFLGCFTKICLVVGLSLGAGTFGWFAGKYWMDSKKAIIPNYTSDLIKKPGDTPSPPTTPILEIENNGLRERLLNLNFTDISFFKQLVDQVFFIRYPEEKNKPRNSSTQNQWDQVAIEILDNISTLKPEILENLGKYTKSDFNSWTLEANKLHLSSRALYNLANGIFNNWFPELQQQPKESFQNQPLGKVWDALVYSQLLSLKLGDNYQKLTDLQSPLTGTLQPGKGKAYTIRLTQGKPMEIKLEPIEGIHLSIYSPTGKKNLLEDSTTGQWSGILPETGYYEIILVSYSKQEINYQLNIKY